MDACVFRCVASMIFTIPYRVSKELFKKQMVLRKVIFKFGEADGFYPDETEEQAREKEEIAKEREGVFHCWIPSLTHCAELNKEIPCVCALVEDCDGKMHEIAIKHIQFQEPIKVDM